MASVPGRSVIVALPLRQELLDQLHQFDLTVLPEGRADEVAFATRLGDADGLLVSSNVLVDRATIASAPRLRVISTMSVGVDHIDLHAAREAGVVVTIAPVLSNAVADLTIALVTMLARRLPEAMCAAVDGRWSAIPLGHDLAGRVLLIVGYGRIGQAVAARALAAHMVVHYFDARDGLPDLAGVTRVTSLSEGLTTADVVSLHVDLNASTSHLLGEREFALMKPSALLVNTARGGVVDQEALVRALSEGKIAGAGLDVLADEPPSSGDPVFSAPNVIIVPHIGSATVETRNAMAQRAVDNLVMVLNGTGHPDVIA